MVDAKMGGTALRAASNSAAGDRTGRMQSVIFQCITKGVNICVDVFPFFVFLKGLPIYYVNVLPFNTRMCSIPDKKGRLSRVFPLPRIG